jgi:hypothetical protein
MEVGQEECHVRQVGPQRSRVVVREDVPDDIPGGHGRAAGEQGHRLGQPWWVAPRAERGLPQRGRGGVNRDRRLAAGEDLDDDVAAGGAPPSHRPVGMAAQRHRRTADGFRADRGQGPGHHGARSGESVAAARAAFGVPTLRSRNIGAGLVRRKRRTGASGLDDVRDGLRGDVGAASLAQ